MLRQPRVHHAAQRVGHSIQAEVVHSWLAPKGESAGMLGGEPKRTGEAESDGGGRERNGSGGVFDQGGDAFGGAEVGLMDDAGFAFDAGAFDDAVVEGVAFLLGDERGRPPSASFGFAVNSRQAKGKTFSARTISVTL